MARRSHYHLRHNWGTIDVVCATCDLVLQSWPADEPVVLGDVVSVANEHDWSEHTE
jgi:predicted RNase H-like nuclease